MMQKNINSFEFTKKSVFNVITLLLLSYFVFHSIYGSRGIIAYFKLQVKLEKSHKQLGILRAERLEIENRTKLLRPDSLDLDMLEEKAKEILSVTRSNEKLFRVEKNEKDNKK